MVKYTPAFLSKLEDVFTESGYILRYEKGNFKSGWCMLHDSNIILVNSYYPLEGKINCLIEILKTVAITREKLTEKSLKVVNGLGAAQPGLFTGA